MFTLENRVAVVTGGSKGIGFSIAKYFLKNNMNVAIISSNQNSVASATKKLCGMSDKKCAGYVCDIKDEQKLRDILRNIYKDFGAIDVLINSAGILDTASIDEMTLEHWNDIVSTNLTGTFFAIKHAIPYLEKSKHPRVVNISSNAGRMGGFENGLAYTASKGGVISLTYGFARRLATKGITVNCIAPGTVESEMSDKYDETTIARLMKRFPIGRLGKSEEIAVAACYFASEEAGFTTGSVLDVNGGMFMG